VVVLAALLNALKIVKKDIRRIKVVVSGVGAAGTATIKILLALGTRNIVGVDEHGTIHRGRRVGMDFMKTWVASATNPANLKGRMSDAIRGADVFIGLSVARVLTVRDVKSMARDRIVFAMANPVPEIQPEEAERHVRVMATGRSDYPNQINNVLAFPGVFRGALDVRASAINEDMKLAAVGPREPLQHLLAHDRADSLSILRRRFDREILSVCLQRQLRVVELLLSDNRKVQ
jgi:malate dehydrogenase (oxaloacetate-decarboxylating)